MTESLRAAAPPVRLTARRERTRRRLLDAAHELLLEEGLLGARVESLCERAGFTRGAFYSNFGSMDDVVVALAVDRQERLVADLSERLPALADLRGTGAERVRAAVDALVGYLPGDPAWQLLTLEAAVLGLRRPEAVEALTAVRDDLQRRLAPLVGAALEASGRRATVPVERLTALVLGAFHGAGLGAGPSGADRLSADRVELVTAVVLGASEPRRSRAAQR